MTDRDDIVELTNRYAWALDAKQCERLADVFTDDVVADYEGPHWTNLTDLIADMTAVHAQLAGTQHLIGSHQVRVTGDQARSGSYAHVVLTRQGESGLLSFSIGSRYEDELIRTARGWRGAPPPPRATWRGARPDSVSSPPRVPSPLS